MHNHRHALEQPVVRAIADKVHVVWGIVRAEPAPPLADQGSNPGLLDRVEDKLGQRVRVVDDNAPEPIER
jgi:hypothetical protein